MGLPKSILITGCNRGLGLGLVKEFLKVTNDSTKIIATCRNKSKAEELMSLETSNMGRVKILELEVAKYEDGYKNFVQQVEKEIGAEGLNLLINNAGISGIRENFEKLTGDNMMDVYRVNCVAPTLLTRALLPLLKRGVAANPNAQSVIEKAAVVQMSSVLASIQENEKGGVYAYRCSKAALNMAMKNMSIELGPEGILSIALHPGWVITDMGGPNADITIDESVSNMVKTILNLQVKDNGAFLKYQGDSIHW